MQEEDTPESTESVNQDGQKAKHPHGNNTGLKQAYDFRDLAAKEAMALQECACTIYQHCWYCQEGLSALAEGN